MNEELIKAGCLRQYMHNDGSSLVAGYDIDCVDRILADKEAEIGFVKKQRDAAEQSLLGAQALIEMQTEAAEKLLHALALHQDGESLYKIFVLGADLRQAISATAPTVAAWEEAKFGTKSDKYRAELYDEVWNKAKSMGYANVTDALEELKPLQQQVAMLLSLITQPAVYVRIADLIGVKEIVTHTQATAEAHDAEVAAKALEYAAHHGDADFLLAKAAELRAGKKGGRIMIFDKEDVIGNLEQMLDDFERNNAGEGQARGNWQDEIDALRLGIDAITAANERAEKLQAALDARIEAHHTVAVRSVQQADTIKKLQARIDESQKPVVWMASTHLSMFEHMACGSDSMFARCSCRQLHTDYKPLYAKPIIPPDVEKLIAQAKAEQREEILNSFPFFNSEEGRWLAEAIRNAPSLP